MVPKCVSNDQNARISKVSEIGEKLDPHGTLGVLIIEMELKLIVIELGPMEFECALNQTPNHVAILYDGA